MAHWKPGSCPIETADPPSVQHIAFAACCELVHPSWGHAMEYKLNISPFGGSSHDCVNPGCACGEGHIITWRGLKPGMWLRELHHMTPMLTSLCVSPQSHPLPGGQTESPAQLHERNVDPDPLWNQGNDVSPHVAFHVCHVWFGSSVDATLQMSF